jgi:hypothetical protein
MPSTIPLKTCAHKGCTFEFPEHFFSDVCAAHTTPESDAVAWERAYRLVPSGKQFGNALGALVGSSPSYK